MSWNRILTAVAYILLAFNLVIVSVALLCMR